MNKNILKLWPELEWIQNEGLREKTARTWEIALEKSVLKEEDLEKIPFYTSLWSRTEGKLHVS